MWSDATEALLSRGVHPLSVDRRVRAMHSVFYAHAVTYDLACLGSDADLAYAVGRNLYADRYGSAETLARGVEYVRLQLRALDCQDPVRLSQGIVEFAGPGQAGREPRV